MGASERSRGGLARASLESLIHTRLQCVRGYEQSASDTASRRQTKWRSKQPAMVWFDGRTQLLAGPT
ncbi:hypothetical protein ACLOJK_030407 [Asimina triloba]